MLINVESISIASTRKSDSARSGSTNAGSTFQKSASALTARRVSTSSLTATQRADFALTVIRSGAQMTLNVSSASGDSVGPWMTRSFMLILRKVLG